MDHGEEVLGKLVVTGGDPTEVFQLGEEPFDEVPLAVEPRAEVWFRPPVSFGWDVGERAFLPERYTDTAGVIGFVCQYDCPCANMIEQIVGGLSVVALPGGQAQPDR